MYRIYLILILLFSSILISATPLYLYEIKGLSPDQALIVSQAGFDIAAVFPNRTAHIILSEQQLKKLNNMGYYGTILRDLSKDLQGIDPAYTDYDEMYVQIKLLESTYPNLVKVYDLGDSWTKANGYGGRQSYYIDHDMWAVKVSNDVSKEQDKPAFLINALHHAREPMSLECLMYALIQMLEGYATNQEYKTWIDSYELWFVPIVNPDGYTLVFNNINANQRNWRKDFRDNNNNGVLDIGSNANGPDGVDLNRNYSKAWESGDRNANSATYRGPSPFSEPEVQVIRDLSLLIKPVISLNLHSYSELVLWPWGWTRNITKEDAILKKFGTDAANAMSYTPEQACDLYFSYGTAEDWQYADLRTFAYCIEIGTSFIPPASQIDPIRKRVWPGLQVMLRYGLGTQVTGHAYKRSTGKPIPNVTITITELDDPQNCKPKFTNGFGRYYWLLMPGNYTINANLLGETTQSVPFSVAQGEVKTIDFYFDYFAGYKGQETAKTSLPKGFNCAPNPFTDALHISFSLPNTSRVKVSAYDLTGHLVKTIANTSFEAGKHTIKLDAKGMANGVYLIKAEFGGQSLVKRVLKVK